MDRIFNNVLSRGYEANVASVQTSKQDGIQLRPYQLDVIRQAAHSALVVQPTGSGKSVTMLTIAGKLKKEGRSIAILVPKLGIASGFEKYTGTRPFAATDPSTGEVVATIQVGGVFQPDGSGKVAQVVDALKKGPCIVVCSYDSFWAAWKQLADEAKQRLMVLLDEAHHSGVAFDPDDKDEEDSSNRMGQLVTEIVSHGVTLHAYTATCFRSDGRPLLPPAARDKFRLIRRTLIEHHADGLCPDFNVDFLFHERVPAAVLDTLARNDEVLGSPQSLLEAMLREYANRRLPTLMIVPARVRANPDDAIQNSRQFAAELERRLRAEFADIVLVNLGSTDGVTLASESPDRDEQYARLNEGLERIDVTIAIKTMDEGVDWVDCAQVFLPNVPASIQLIIQRLGRALRSKRVGHPSRWLSHLCFFETGILADDRTLVTAATARLALRLKCLCNGSEFIRPWVLDLPTQIRHAADQEKENITSQVDVQGQFEVDQTLNTLANKGAKVPALIEAVRTEYADRGVKVSDLAAFELLVERDIVSVDDQQKRAIELSQQNAARLNRNHATWFVTDPEMVAQLRRLTVNGVERFVSILNGGHGTDAEIRDALAEILQADEERLLAAVESHLRQHGRTPPRTTTEGKWCAHQREAYRTGTIADDRRAKLDALTNLGWEWDLSVDARFQAACKSLATAIADGTLKYGDENYLFVVNSRADYKSGKLSGERRAMLEAIPGFPGWRGQIFAKPDPLTESVGQLDDALARGPVTNSRKNGQSKEYRLLQRMRGLHKKGELTPTQTQILQAKPLVWEKVTAATQQV